MTPSLKAVPPAVAQPELSPAPPINRPLLWLLFLLSARVKGLEAEREKLLAALRRESHSMDVRAPHSGR